jgi:hypothetical protein
VAAIVGHLVYISQELLLVAKVSLKCTRLLLRVESLGLLPCSSSSIEAA